MKKACHTTRKEEKENIGGDGPGPHLALLLVLPPFFIILFLDCGGSDSEDCGSEDPLGEAPVFGGLGFGLRVPVG